MRDWPRRAPLLALFALGVAISAQTSREAILLVNIGDAATGEPTPARVWLTDARGETPPILGIEQLAVMWGRFDRPEGYALQPDGSFYADGAFQARLSPGDYTLRIEKGYEYEPRSETIEAKAGALLERDYRLDRWIDMPARGWYSADDHIHIRRSPRENAKILRWTAAEDIHVGNLLQMGDFWNYVYGQYAFGEAGRYREGSYLLSPGQEEPRTPEIGHTISLGANDFVRFQKDYYSYDQLFDRVHELGGLSGFAHQGMSFHGYRGMTMNVLRGKVDFLELVQFCVANGPIHTEHYYRFLDLGFPLTALAGSDFPWCGRGSREGERSSRIGDARFYTYLGGDEFSFESWFSALEAGRTFATTGPVVELTVNGMRPGSTVNVGKGDAVRITAKAYGDGEQIPLRELAIIGHGRTLATAKASEAGQSTQSLAVELELPVEHGLWIAARADGLPGQLAHTTPVYVSVDGGGFHNPATVGRNLDRCEQDLQGLEQELREPGDQLDSQASRHAAELHRQIAETRAIIASLRERLAP
ncbi:MAG: CehA/McbA family metallohydrolase [Bryobacterales bacterium]|nr:CehA/McbA family metallohydrolase [Bryobacterales bacterium]